MEEVNDCFSLFRLPKFYEVRTNKANWLSSAAFFTSMMIRFFSLLHSWVRATTYFSYYNLTKSLSDVYGDTVHGSYILKCPQE